MRGRKIVKIHTISVNVELLVEKLVKFHDFSTPNLETCP